MSDVREIRNPAIVANLMGDVAVMVGNHQRVHGRMTIPDGTGTAPMLETEDTLLRVFAKRVDDRSLTWADVIAGRVAHVWGETDPGALIYKLAELAATALDWAEVICERIDLPMPEPAGQNLILLVRVAREG